MKQEKEIKACLTPNSHRVWYAFGWESVRLLHGQKKTLSPVRALTLTVVCVMGLWSSLNFLRQDYFCRTPNPFFIEVQEIKIFRVNDNCQSQ